MKIDKVARAAYRGLQKRESLEQSQRLLPPSHFSALNVHAKSLLLQFPILYFGLSQDRNIRIGILP
jgi:hypothetical protein